MGDEECVCRVAGLKGCMMKKKNGFEDVKWRGFEGRSAETFDWLRVPALIAIVSSISSNYVRY